MAARFTDTEIWDEDWFINLGMEHQHLWNYIKDNCNHAGIWKPNKTGFEMRTNTKVNLDSFFKRVNGDKERILRLNDGNWFLTGFIKFQWFNKKESFDLALSNRLHLSIFNELKKYSVPLEKVRGLKEVLQTSKVKDKEKDIVLGEEGTGEEDMFNNEHPQTVLQLMAAEWKKVFPNYPFMHATDPPQLLELAKFICKGLGKPFNPSDQKIIWSIVNQFRLIVFHMKEDNLFRKWSINTLAKPTNYQSVIHNMNQSSGTSEKRMVI